MPIFDSNSSDVRQIFDFDWLELELIPSILHKGDGLLMAVITRDMPELSARLEPLKVLLLELFVSECLKDFAHIFWLISYVQKSNLEQRERLLVRLLVIKVFPIGKELLLNLIKNFSEIIVMLRVFHGEQLLNRLLDVNRHRVVEARPRKIDIVVHRGH